MTDISAYISRLLFEFDCVVVPGFGGFVGNYKSSEIEFATHTIYPPSKTISFNRLLKTNDGTLVNYICTQHGLSYESANRLVENWVALSNNMLKQGEVIYLQKIGNLSNDIEGNIQFTPDTTVNYLKSSFGLQPIIAAPVIRGREIEYDTSTKTLVPTVKITQPSKWRLAALVVLLVGIAGLVTSMGLGWKIQSFELNEASVMNWLLIGKHSEPDIKLLPIYEEESVDSNIAVAQDTVATNNTSLTEATPTLSNDFTSTEAKYEPDTNTNGYFVIVGAFAEESNTMNAIQELQATFNNNTVFVEQGKRLTKVGLFAGNSFREAQARLNDVKSDYPEAWLLRKKP